MSSIAVSSSPSSSLAILSARASSDRSPHELISDRIRDSLKSFAAALKKIEANPVLSAKIAVTFLEHLALDFSCINDIEALKLLWKDQDRQKFISEIQIIRAAFSLPTEVFQEYRDRDPEFVFSYAIIQGLLRGRLPVVASDLKDTLASWVESNGATGITAKERRAAAGFRGIYEAIDEALKVGPFFIITGDENKTVLKHFVLPNGWVKESDKKLVARNSHARNLFWLPRTGMEVVRFDFQKQEFLRSPLVPGLNKSDLLVIREVTAEVSKMMNLSEYFNALSRRYEYTPEWPPQSIMEREGLSEGQSSAAFFPAGQLLQQARPRFKADRENAPLLELIVNNVRRALAERGCHHIMVNRGGLSTIDFVTCDKGIGLEYARQNFLIGSEFIVFIGDKIALNGNDRPAADIADLSIQVGDEWDWQLYPEGDRILLRSKASAKEGGAAEYIRKATLLRRLGLTEILAPERLHAVATKDSTTLNLPSVDRPSVGKIYKALKTRVQEVVQLDLSKIDQEQQDRIKGEITELIAQLSLRDEVDRDPIRDFDIAILQRVVQGDTPVLASDLKDTLAVFDVNGVDWFPGAKNALQDALLTGPYFLITGDSLKNIHEGFLLKSGILEGKNGDLKSSFKGMSKLHLITRTGLDRVIFNFSTGVLERFPLVNGIRNEELVTVLSLLDQVTKQFRCAEETFASYRHREGYGPGFVEIRGREFGDGSLSFAFFPAGVLLTEERARFRTEMMQSQHFRGMVAEIRKLLIEQGLGDVIAQQGGISTIDLTTSTKGSALAQLKEEILNPNDFFVFIGDTITQYGNDGSAVVATDFSIQVGKERDPNLRPPPDHIHIHSPIAARDGGAAVFINLVVQARQLAGTGLWNRSVVSTPRIEQVPPLPGTAVENPFTKHLESKPWETPLALKRLTVPNLLLPRQSPLITKWAVITGATSAGKTTLIKALEDRGYPVLHEVARGWVEGELRKGRTIVDVRGDDYAFRHRVFNLTKEAEASLLARSHELIFFDRSSIDSISFHRGSGYDPDEIVVQLDPYRFGWVFHCNPLPFQNDGLRTANEPRRYFLDSALERDYRALGYDPIRLPGISVEERVDLVLQTCGINKL